RTSATVAPLRCGRCSPPPEPGGPGGRSRPGTSASMGLDILLHRLERLASVEFEVFQDRVAAGPGARRVQDRLGELLDREADVARQPGQPVPPEAREDLLQAFGALAEVGGAQVEAERRAETRQLAVVGGVGVELVDGVQD